MRSPDRGSRARYSLRRTGVKTGGYHEYAKGENRRSPPAWAWVAVSTLFIITLAVTLTVNKNPNVTKDVTSWLKYKLGYEVVVATKEAQ